MKLFQDFLQLFRDRQSQMGRVLQNADTLIGQVEENDCGTQHTAFAKHIDIHNVANAHHSENQNLTADTLETNGTGEVLIGDGAHDAGDVVDYRKGNQRIQKAVNTTQELSKEATESGECNLNARPDLFHSVILHFVLIMQKGLCHESRSPQCLIRFVWVTIPIPAYLPAQGTTYTFRAVSIGMPPGSPNR